MWMSIVSRAALLAVALTLAVPDRAEACSGPVPIHVARVAPADTASGVPLNARVYVDFSGSLHGASPEVLEALLVRPKGGDPVDANVVVLASANPGQKQVVVTPVHDLAPNTEYELHGRVRAFDCELDCVAPSPELLATFTTGAARDAQPPAFAGATGVIVKPDEQCDSSSCCGPFSGTRIELEVSPPPDAAALRLYMGSLDAEPLPIRGPKGMVLCDGQVISGYAQDFVVPRGKYFVRAIDLAGNEAGNTEPFNLEANCPDNTPSRSATGCASVPGPFLIALALIGAAVLRRRAVARRCQRQRD